MRAPPPLGRLGTELAATARRRGRAAKESNQTEKSAKAVGGVLR